MCTWLIKISCEINHVWPRAGFREHEALGHLSFWGPKHMWHIWPFVWKAWKSAPLMCSAPSEIYVCCADFGSTFALVRCSAEIEVFRYILLKNKWHCDLFLEFVALSCSSEVLLVKFSWFLAFFLVFFFLDVYIFMRDRVAALENIV